MQNPLRASLFIACFMVLFAGPASVSAAEPRIRVVFDEPVRAVDRAALEAIKDAKTVEQFVRHVESNFVLQRPLILRFGGDDGPLADLDTGTIHVPYDHLVQIDRRFAQSKYRRKGIDRKEATQHVLTESLFHELGHVLIDTYGLPVAGKEEDAADGLAIMALIRLYPNGREMAISSADLYAIWARDNTPEKEDFFGEHSLDIQRHYSTLCHVYGSDPKGYAWLAQKAGFPKERRDRCEVDFQILDESWLLLLEPHLKKRAPLRKP